MANWVANEMIVEGDAETVEAFVKKMAKPTYEFNKEEVQEETGEVYSLREDRVLSFLNVIAPLDSEWEEYFSVADNNSWNNPLNWYNWNTTHWSTKWDALRGVITGQGDGVVTYFFETAWSPPEKVFYEMSKQWPTLTFKIVWEEGQGFGAVWVFRGGELLFEETWDIPESHADFVERGKVDQCVCQYSMDEDAWFEDCPRG